MNIVSVSNRWLNRVYKTAAILLVLLAVLISAFRLFLPYVHHYKVPLQNLINEQSQTNIVIGELSMTWQRFGPVLLIGDVKVLQTENATVFIDQLELKVDFWRTLTSQRIISKNLTLSGVKANVSDKLWLDNQNEQDDEISVQDEDEVNDVTVLSDLFLNRINRFSIKDSEITVRNQSMTRHIKLNQLKWLNSGDRHQAEGSVVLNELSSNNLKLKLDLQGEYGSELDGQVYLQANHLDITPWLDRLLVLDDDKTSTDINFSAWMRIRESSINRMHIDFDSSSMHWRHENKQQQLSLGEGQLLLVKRKRARSFNLYSTEFELQLNNEPAQSLTAMMVKQAEDFSLHLSQLNLAMFSQLTPLIVSSPDSRKTLSDMQLSGNLEDIYIQNKNEKLQVIANFSQFNNRFSHGVPGIENVAGQLSFSDDYLAIDFSAQNGALDFDKLFVQPFPYQTLSGKMHAGFTDEGWSLSVESLDFISEDINLSAQLRVNAPENKEVELSLLTSVSNADAGLVGRYLPLPIMSENLVEYLNAAVVSGRIEDAQVLINGPISHFPFTDGSGIFIVDAELSDSEFKFAESWPAINDFVANLNFTNNGMMITGRGGSLNGLDMTGVTAGIADLAKGQLLKVDAEIRPTAAHHIGDLMHGSPLKESVGSTLDYLNISGDVSGSFNLNVPLKDTSKTVAQGEIIFDNNELDLQAPSILFKELKGQLTFVNDAINTEELHLTWQGLPVNLDIIGENKSGYYDIAIDLSASWSEQDWQSYVPKELQSYIQGELPWQGKLSLYQHHAGGFSYKARLASDLKTTTIKLPEPYNKQNNEAKPFIVELDGQVDSAKITANYGEQLHFSGLLNHESAVFSRANLMLGKGLMPLPQDGFHISTQLTEVNFSQWQGVISDILDVVNQPTETNTTPLISTPEKIRGTISELDLYGQTLTQVSFNLLEKSQWWLLQLNANETRSQIKIYPDWLNQGLDINAEYLHLPIIDDSSVNSSATAEVVEKALDKTQNDLIFANIPAMNFHCDSCKHGLLNLGQVDFKVKRTDAETVEFIDFTASRNDTRALFSGKWRHNAEISITDLTGQIFIDDLESELKALSFASIVKDSGAEVNIDLNWQGGLHDFDVNKVTGDISAALDDGYLADVSDKARIFSVLSLQSLVRKLTLDFRDIFSDGMFYSNITGDYHLEQGLLTTNNTEMAGTAGDLFMKGHTNLISGELDYDMTYKPNLTSSLPVLAWIATLNPVTFLAGVAIDQVIKSQVVSEFNFALTGTVEDPKFLEVNRKSKDISVENNVKAPELTPLPAEPPSNDEKQSSPKAKESTDG